MINVEDLLASGWKYTKKENPNFKCRVCDCNDILYHIWESRDGAHEDYFYKCCGCKRNWIVEGSDY